MAANARLLLRALQIYWKALFVIIYPLALLPIFILNNTSDFRCLYVTLLMAGLWVTEAIPLPVTAMIPMVLFPLMGILHADQTSLCYLKDTNMMFVGGLIIAIAIEHCNLHRRMALYVILGIGCSPRRLNFGLVAVAMFVSMWISNTAAIAMMCPIMEATLKELESQGIGDVYEKSEVEKGEVAEENRRPSKTTICYFLSAAYASSIGGLGCIVGSGTNLTFKGNDFISFRSKIISFSKKFLGLYETIFPDSPGIEFASWMFLNVPIMLITMLLSWVWLQFVFMGLFRPNSPEAKQTKIGPQGELVARKLIKQKLDEMGPITFHEVAVGTLFILSVFLWFFRKPQFIPGWAEQITQHKVSVIAMIYLASEMF